MFPPKTNGKKTLQGDALQGLFFGLLLIFGKIP